tara:strand:- start:127 stop:642 length:516 start_codon:yes stop_codon:yes gene_type:complete
MSGGGGKGGKETTTSGIPDWVQAPAERNIDRAELAQKIGYMPYYGPDVAAFNPTQLAAFNSNIGAAEAFGMVPQGSLTAMQGMAPQANTYAGGLQAYSSGNLFDQALAELESRRPGQFAQYNKMFVNPLTGVDPTPPPVVQQAQAGSGSGRPSPSQVNNPHNQYYSSRVSS